MKKYIVIFGLLLMMLNACNQNKTVTENYVVASDSLSVTEAGNKEVHVLQPDSTGVIQLPLVGGKIIFEVVKQKDETIYIQFDSEDYHSLSARVFSDDSTANIRFSEIYLPDGNTDGPFGRELNYELPDSGIYRIALHENMMAGDPWNGRFSVEMNLSE